MVMDIDRTFSVVNDAVLVRSIMAAKQKIIYVAPGVQVAVAKAIAARLENSPHMEFSIVLDIDPEICRLGYGHIDGLSLLKEACAKHGSLLLHQPGIRIGLFIADDLTLIYAPTPLLIVDDPKREDRPNAIRISTASVPAVEAACTTKDGSTVQEIGLDPAQTPDIKAVQNELKINPPQKFDVSRAIRVFNSRILFVDFKFEGYKLSLRQVIVPPELLGLADSPQMAARWHNTFRPFQEKNALSLRYLWIDENKLERIEYITERTLEEERHAIKRKYLKDIKGYGVVILRSDVEAFEKDLERLRKKVEDFQKHVSDAIKAVIADSSTNLVADLWPKVKGRNPGIEGWDQATEYRRTELLKERVEAVLNSAFEKYQPYIQCRYKAVDSSGLDDGDFMSKLKAAYREQFSTLFREYDAAPSASSSGKSIRNEC